MPLKIVTVEEWKAMGLPTEISTVHFSNAKLVNKIKKNRKKLKQKKELVKYIKKN